MQLEGGNIFGTRFSDDIRVDFGFANGGDGNDTIQVNLNIEPFPATLSGAEGDDSLYGGEAPDFLSGDAGDDVIEAYAGDDTLVGGVGNDLLRGYGGRDRLEGAGGNDSLNGGAGADRLYGQNGNDTLNGGGGNDLLFGGATSADRIIGGPGDNDRAADDDQDTYSTVEVLLD